MNPESWILLIIVLALFVAALIRCIKGGVCSCGSECSGCGECSECGKCQKKKKCSSCKKQKNKYKK